MNNDFSALENAWNNGKKNLNNSSEHLKATLAQIEKNKNSNFMFYYGTLVILTATWIGISCFFYFVAPVQQILSRIGVGLMIIGLLIRIIVEIATIVKSKKVHVNNNSLSAINNSLYFYRFRTRVHYILAPIIVILYTVGFYMITPEFLDYLSLNFVIFFDIVYLVLAIFLFVQIRKGVQKEIQILQKTIELKQEILGAEKG